MKKKEKKGKKEFWLAGVVAGFTAITCCIAPPILILLGLSTAFGMAFMHQFHTVSLVSGAILMILITLYIIKKKSGVCNFNSIKDNWINIVSVMAIMIGSYLFINYLIVAPMSNAIYGGIELEQKPLGNLVEMAETHGMSEMAEIEVIPEMEGNKKLTLEIGGIFCGSCSAAIDYDVRSILGVYSTELDGQILTVKYDSDVTSKDIIMASIHDPYFATIISEEKASLFG